MSTATEVVERVRLGERCYPLYRRLFDEDGEFVERFDRTLAASDTPDAVEFYLSRALGVGLLAGLALWLCGVGLAGLFVDGSTTLLGVPLPPALVPVVEAVKLPALVFATGLLFGTLGFAVTFGAFLAVPYVRADARKREINYLLADAVSYMYALSVGGVNQLEILRSVAAAEDTYGEVAREFQSIVLETEYFDTDYRTAIRNRAEETPSEELSGFLTDMLSIIDSGGDMEGFLDDKKHRYMRIAKQENEETLETLELFGELFMTISLFPLLLVVIIVVMSMLGRAGATMLYLTVYGLLPLTGVAFLLLVAVVKVDERTDGILRIGNDRDDLPFGPSISGDYVGRARLFSRVHYREWLHEVVEVLRKPHAFFRDHPPATLAFTVPMAGAVVAAGVVSGHAPTSWTGVVEAPVATTVLYLYVPLFVTLTPLSAFHEWNLYARRRVLRTLSEDLRKLASANDTGLTLLEAMGVVADTSSGRLAEEFARVRETVHYGVGLREALYRFNNRYRLPRLARTVKLVAKAQETSSRISPVLATAAQASENADDIERERRSRARMQVVVITVTFLTLLGVMAVLKTQFVDVMARLAAGASDTGSTMGGFASVDTALLSLLFFHAVTIQAVVSGLVAGYVREASLASGLKYCLGMLAVALVVWTVVG